MRTTILLAAVAVVTLTAGSAEARGRIRFHFPWSSQVPASRPAEARPQGEGRIGGVLLRPIGGRPITDRRDENAAVAALPSVTPPTMAAPKPPVPAIEAKARSCPPSGLFGAGVGFCAVN